MGNGDKLLPTPSAFRQYLLRTLVQAFIWRHAHMPEIPVFPVQKGFFGWKWDENEWKPIPSGAPAAPPYILDIVKWNCSGTSELRACSCFKNSLRCTEMCHVSLENYYKNTDPRMVQEVHSDNEDLFVCGISLKSGQLINELFPDCRKVMLFASWFTPQGR